jgi:hypothetical protein
VGKHSHVFPTTFKQMGTRVFIFDFVGLKVWPVFLNIQQSFSNLHFFFPPIYLLSQCINLPPQKNADYHLVIKQQLKWTADLKQSS